MWKFFRKFRAESKDQLETDLNPLIRDLQRLGAELELNDLVKNTMKSNVLNSIAQKNLELPQSLNTVRSHLDNLAKTNFLSMGQKRFLFAQIKEKRLRRSTRYNWSFLFKSLRTALASFLIFVFAMTFFVISPLDLRLTKAAKWTFLEDVRGEVFVNRAGRIFAVNKDFALAEGDLIFTRQDSFVVIRFLDDSVARLGENTSLEIVKLYVRPENLVNTDVQLSLVGGQLWASVYNLIDNESEFVVETENALAKVNNKAAFEMTTQDKTTSLAVFDNVVDFSKKPARAGQVQPVVSGFKAEVDSSKVYQLAYTANDVVVTKNDRGANDWAQMNLGLDQQHEDKLKEENNKFIAQAVNQDNLVGALSDFKDTTKLMFNNADIEQARVKFNDANSGFLKAQKILNDAGNSLEKRREALPYIYAYKAAIKEIMDNYSNLEKEDAVQANSLFAQMKESVDIQRKALSLVMPEENLYTAKYVVDEVSLNFAINDSEKAQYLLAEARERLLEVETLIQKDQLKKAEAGFRAYLTDLDDLVSLINQAKVADIEPKLFALIDEQIKQFKVLNAIEKNLQEKDDQILLALVTRVNNSSLRELLQIFKDYRRNGIPFEMLAELNNTIESYFSEGPEKTQSLEELKALMRAYPEYKEMESKAVDLKEASSQPEVVVDFNATKDISADDQVTGNNEQQAPDETKPTTDATNNSNGDASQITNTPTTTTDTSATVETPAPTVETSKAETK